MQKVKNTYKIGKLQQLIDLNQDNTNFKAEDAFTKEEFINIQLTYSTSYKVQDKHFDTIKTENKAVEDLINKISQEILIKISEIIK